MAVFNLFSISKRILLFSLLQKDWTVFLAPVILRMIFSPSSRCFVTTSFKFKSCSLSKAISSNFIIMASIGYMYNIHSKLSSVNKFNVKFYFTKGPVISFNLICKSIGKINLPSFFFNLKARLS